MKKLIIPALICLSLFTAPAFSEPNEPKKHELSELPKDLLVQGLQASVVCMEIEGYGIKRLIGFYDENKADSTTETSEAGKSALAASVLYEEFLIEKALAIGIVKTFKDKYNMDVNTISGLVKDEADATKQIMADKYDKIDNYEDFTAAYEPSLKSCSQALKSFTDKAKSIVEELEKQQ